MIPISRIYSPPVSLLWNSKFHSFNHMQSEVCDCLANSNDNIVISAPTGAGKTCGFEMAMARLFNLSLNDDTTTPSLGNHTKTLSNSRKVVYMTPSKALCEERYDDWSRRLSSLNIGITCVTVTGDSNPNTFRRVATSHEEIDVGTLLQMIGRAGRPGFDTCGTAVIMTDTKS